MADAGPTTAQVEAKISEEILQLHKDSYGVGGDVKTYVLEDEVLVIIDIDVTQAERTLLDAGQEDAVRETRHAFQDAISATFKALIERETGRRVISFMSTMNIEPLYSVEFFRLGPQGPRYQTS